MHRDGRERLADAVTALFVPGDRPERFARAAAAGADLVLVDLEDAVATDAKQRAREAAAAALADGLVAAVRVNPLGTGLGEADLAALAAASAPGLLGIMVPKAEGPEVVSSVDAWLPGLPVLALVETARGVREATAIAEAGPVRLAFGALDYALDVGGDDPRLADSARIELVVASRAAGIAAPLDSPTPEIRDLDAVAAVARAAAGLGFGGMLCIHPAQVTAVAGAFAPTADEIEWARRILTAGDGGAVQVDGRMVDRPVVERALRILGEEGA